MYILLIILIIIIIYFFIPFLLTELFYKPKSKILLNQAIYLTFDDGPDPNSTIEILNVLNEKNIKSTFFILGINAVKHTSIIKEIIRNGHEIGEHSFYHYHPWKIDPFRYIMDLIKSCRLINKINRDFQIRIHLFRPPFGKLNIITIIYAIITNKRIIFWDVDPKDYLSLTSNEVTQYILNNSNDKSIILLHDSRLRANLSHTDITVEVVRQISDSKNQLSFSKLN